jgi:hypothetical protein
VCKQLGSEAGSCPHDPIHARAQILETTMHYLGITNLDSLTDKIDAAAANIED